MAQLAKTALGSLAFGYLALLLTAWLLSDRLMFPMPPNAYSIEGLTRLPIRGGAEIVALHLPHPEARFTLLYSHGNGEDLESVLPLLEEYRRRGMSVLAYDYPGYGRSSGRSSEASLYASIDAVYAYLADLGVAPDDIVVYGRSMGSGPSVDLAVRKPVAGLILEGGYISAFRVITRLPLLPWDKFENERKLPRLNRPVLIMQAANDHVVGYWHGPRLLEAANEPKTYWRVEGAGHNDLTAVGGEAYWRKISAFLESL